MAFIDTPARALALIEQTGSAKVFASKDTMMGAPSLAGQAAVLIGAGSGTFMFQSASDYQTSTGIPLTSDVALDSQRGAVAPPKADPSGASGAWVRIDPDLTPAHFGAAGDGKTDDSTPFQAWSNFYFAAVRKQRGNAAGNFATTKTLTVGPKVASTDHWAQRYALTGDCRVVALTALTEIINCNNLSDADVTGFRLTAVGTGSGAYSSRTCGIGIVLNNCANGLMAACRAFATLYHGVYAPSTGLQANDCFEIEHVRGGYCGSGPISTPSQCLTANWSNPVNSGSSGVVTQTVTISVDTLPPALLDNYEPWGIKQCAVWINNMPYAVTAVDRVGSTITLATWLDANDGTSGTLIYIFGAAFATYGGDSGIINVGHMEVLNCGMGLSDQALYGSRVNSANIENTSIAIGVGGLKAAHYGTSVDALYSLDNTPCHIVNFAAPDYSSKIASGYDLQISKCYSIGVRARNSSTNEFSGGAQFNFVDVDINGRLHSYLQVGTLQTPQNAVSAAANTPPIPLIFTGQDNFTLNLDNDANGKWSEIFGYRGGFVWISGTGANNAPSGTITVTPPTNVLTGCSTTAGSTLITVPLSSTSLATNALGTKSLVVGQPVSGTNIPAGATVASIVDRTHFNLDAGHPASGTGSNLSLTFTGSVNGTYGNVTFTGFNGPVCVSWKHTDGYEMVMVVDIVAGKVQPQVVDTSAVATYTPVLADHGKLKRMNNGTGVTVTLPSDSTTSFATGQWIDFAQLGAGQITFSPDTGVTINSRGALVKTAGQYAVVRAEKTASNTWLLSGDRA